MTRCRGCGRLAFPPRLWCPDCSSDAWEEAEARDGTGVATVVLDSGPPVLARVERVQPGSRVRLDAKGGVPVARPG